MKKISSVLIAAGAGLIIASLVIFTLIFYPVFKVELNYDLQAGNNLKKIEPLDKNFGIVIPKISANAKVIANINPYSEKEYQWALTKGVAQAKGTVNPGEVGNIFLFSHSSVNFFEASRYNSIFYLLSKLESQDEIDLYYQGQKYVYKVTDKKTVDASNIQYLTGKSNGKTLTLMTCWPPGTTYKRLLVIAEAQ